jgi:hypothetical protein
MHIPIGKVPRLTRRPRLYWAILEADVSAYIQDLLKAILTHDNLW